MPDRPLSPTLGSDRGATRTYRLGLPTVSTPAHSRKTIMRATLSTISLIAAAIATPAAFADPSAAKPGEHPAIAARRVIAAQGYDYASKFYPHPAWLYLSAQAPHPMSDHPAVIVFRRAERERQAVLDAAPATLVTR
jgi:hypothetical protein